MHFSVNEPILPEETFVLSDGASNELLGDWPDRFYAHISRLELHYFKAKHPTKAQALVFGGGGYQQLVHDKEGVEIAHWLNNIGIDAYVVTHRLPGAVNKDGSINSFDIALRDGLTCLELIKQRSSLPLIHVGLSSGGHMAGVMACQKEPVRAVGAIITYAPINANHHNYKAPAGKPDYPPVEKQNFYNAWPIGIDVEPHGIPTVPLFVAYALHDQAVPVDHVLNLIKTAQINGNDVEAHIYPDAPHGFGLREKLGTHAQWYKLAERWINKVIGDKS